MTRETPKTPYEVGTNDPNMTLEMLEAKLALPPHLNDGEDFAEFDEDEVIKSIKENLSK
ncbi:MAG: hypothetical protein QM523_07045 [Candidatus Pacebacteria bacterium]|nr:hypothetical protein [Candidatus Paceibacterota bacterium]